MAAVDDGDDHVAEVRVEQILHKLLDHGVRHLAALLAFPGCEPQLTTDAPATVGVNLNIGTSAADPLLTLDLNNCDLTAEMDKLQPAPACTTTIRLSSAWRGRALAVTCISPENKEFPLAAGCTQVDRKRGVLALQTPPFETMLIVCIRPERN